MIRISSMKTLGSRIAHYRKEAGLTQGQLAKRCGWASQSRVGNYENDSREPTLGDLKNIADKLDISLMQLIEAEGHPQEDAPHRVVRDISGSYGDSPSPDLMQLHRIAADLNEEQLKLLCGIAELIRKG